MKRTSRSDDKQPLVLIVEDDENSAELLRTFVESQGFGTAVANSLADARQQLVLHAPSVVLLDLHLPDGSGMDLFDDETLRGESDIILITGNASVETSVQALRLGAADYLIKPVSLKVLRSVFGRLQDSGHGEPVRAGQAGAQAGGRSPAVGSNQGRFSPVRSQPLSASGDDDRWGDDGPSASSDATEASEGTDGPGGREGPEGREGRGERRGATGASARGSTGDQPLIRGSSEQIREILHQIDRVARTSVSVFIVGESGTGKELVAESVHRASRRRNGPFEAINCGAISAQLIESELFGHEKGSFTGAIRQHKGFFERASGGTLFLDEITEMSLDLQVKLLRVLETGTFSRVGSDILLRSDVRIIAATNRDPFKAIGDGRLREDLYYRLNVFQILLPPLRERLEDIPDLAEHFMAAYNEQEGGKIHHFTPAAMAAIQRYDWPGNVRELRNFVHRTVILGDRDPIDADDLPPFDGSPGRPDGTGPAGAAGRGTGTIVPAASASSAGGRPADVGVVPALTVTVGSTIADMERALILATLDHYGGAKERTAEVLGISLKTLYNRLRSYED